MWQEWCKNICSVTMNISVCELKVNETGSWNSSEGTDIDSSLGVLFLKKGHASD